jgi:hypothetical protein
LAEDVNKPVPGGMYVSKGLLEPFTKGVNDVKFMAEVCEKMNEASF